MIDIIAELSCNFGDDMALAKEMIESASQNGATYVKFQWWKVDNLKDGSWDTDGRKEFYCKSELNFDKVEALKKMCGENDVKFLVSCFSHNDLDDIRTFSDEVKIPGIECSNRDMVLEAISKFKKVFISVASTDIEIYKEYASYPNVYLMHCVYSYPCPPENVNIDRVSDLAKITSNVGYSGHYLGILDAVGASFLGAKVIEKHFTTNRSLEFRDNKFSILPDELKSLREHLNEIEKMKIYYGSGCQDCEKGLEEEYKGRWDK